jgi:putative FmdB family regulatory protein
MPIYEYECPGCGGFFEKRVGFSESDEKQRCPKCGNEHARRQLSVIGGISGGSVGTVSAPACGPVG